MSNPCQASTCVNGNCPGCRNGAPFCNDPRCFPNCPNCTTTVSTTSSNWVIITIILILLIALLVFSFIIGFDWFSSRKKAAEPKNLTVNRHVHQVQPPDIVVNSPPPTVIKESPTIINESSTLIMSKPKISCDGVSLSMEGLNQK